MRLLVVGGERVDAGKTTFSVGLLERTGAVGFKPRAGNDLWFDHDDVRHATGRERLFGKDARKLADASPGTFDPEDLNPVHRLWRPAPGSGSGVLGRTDREFLVDRVGDRYVVNDTVDLPRLIHESLPLDDAVRVDSLPSFNDVMSSLHVPALSDLADSVAAADRAVVESYADVARPMRDAAPDAVAVVEPRRVRVYDGDRWVKACEVAGGGRGSGRLEERVPSVVDLADPAATRSIPPLGADQRADLAAVADAYHEAYEVLLATAAE